MFKFFFTLILLTSPFTASLAHDVVEVSEQTKAKFDAQAVRDFYQNELDKCLQKHDEAVEPASCLEETKRLLEAETRYQEAYDEWYVLNCNVFIGCPEPLQED